MTSPRVRDYSAAILIDSNERFLLQLRDERPDIAQPGKIGFFGGGRKGDETHLECIVREIAEEIGVELPSERFEHLISLDRPDPENVGGHVKGEYFVVRGIAAPSLNVTEGSLLIIERDELPRIRDKLTPLTVLVLFQFLGTNN